MRWLWSCVVACATIGAIAQDGAIADIPDTTKIYSLDQVSEVPEYLTAAGIDCSPAERTERCSPTGPIEACDIQTKVIVSFIVERDGRLTSPEIKSSSCKAFEDAALCHVRGMRPWKPAHINEVPVRTRMILPVQYDVR